MNLGTPDPMEAWKPHKTGANFFLVLDGTHLTHGGVGQSLTARI